MKKMKIFKTILAASFFAILLISCTEDDLNSSTGTYIIINGDKRHLESTNSSLELEKGITHNADWEGDEMKTIYLRVKDRVGDVLPDFGGITYDPGEDSEQRLLLKINLNEDFTPGTFNTYDWDSLDDNILPKNGAIVSLKYTVPFVADEGLTVNIEENDNSYIVTFNSLNFTFKSNAIPRPAIQTATISGRIKVNK